MTQMQHAFANAERQKQEMQQKQPKPATERVWLWLRDHPKQPSSEAVKVFGDNASMTIQSLLSRGMLVWEEEFNPKAGRNRRLYSVEPKMRGAYELWPEIKTKKEKRKAKRAVETAAAVSVSREVPPQPPQEAVLTAAKPPKSSAPSDTQIPACLRNVPMQEALEAYKYLKGLFGDM